MTFARLAFIALPLTIVGCAASADVGSDDNGGATESSAATRASCGGIAGLQCPEGQKCVIKETYPDAMGTCVGAQEKLNCAAVLCAMPLCAQGYELYTPPGACCPSCRPVKGVKRDCTTTGCATGEYCTVCRTISGPANVCLPNGAAC